MRCVQLREARKTNTEGDNYRRPFDYQPLCGLGEEAPAPAAAPAGGAAALKVALLQLRPNSTTAQLLQQAPP